MAAVSPAQPEPRITVERISVMWVPVSILTACRGQRPCTGPAALIKMKLMANLTLIYGLRLPPEGEVTAIEDATLKLANGHEAHVTMHMIEGSREEIETQ